MSLAVLNNLDNFPHPDVLKKASQSLAMLEAIIMPEWDYRYFSFNNFWDNGESMGSMRDGEGNELFILFYASTAIGKVFAKDHYLSNMDIDVLKSQVPSKFSRFINEPAFSMNDISFCFWYENLTKKWTSKFISNDFEYLGFFCDYAEYHHWAEEYYEKEIDISIVKDIYNHTPATKEIIERLNCNSVFLNVINEAKEIGYPYQIS